MKEKGRKNTKWNIIRSSFHKKTSSILLAIVIGLVVISFLFSGGQTMMKGTPDTMAQVGQYRIKIAEFERAFENSLKMYSRMMGGKSLTSKQIEAMDLQNKTLSGLINQKLALILAGKLGINPSNTEIKDQIKTMMNVKERGFDVETYKRILRYNRTTPKEFESGIKSDLTMKKFQNLVSNIPVSNGYVSALNDFKSNVIKLDIFKLDKRNVNAHIPVSKTEIKKYLSEGKNLDIIKALFTQRKNSLDKPEEVLTSHILLRPTDKKTDKDIEKEIKQLRKKITPKNFAKLANKNTMDPGGKGKGGELNWFRQGQMDKAFEQTAFATKVGQISDPVKTNFGWHLIYVRGKKKAYNATFEKHKNELAKENIRRQKVAEGKKLVQAILAEVKVALKNKNYKKLAKLKKKYNAEYQKNLKVNKLDGIPANFEVTPIQANQVFNGEFPKIHSFDNVIDFVVISANKKETIKDKQTDEKMTQEKMQQSYLMSNQLNQELIKNISQNVKIRDFNLLQNRR